jgi:hypothetical protein
VLKFLVVCHQGQTMDAMLTRYFLSRVLGAVVREPVVDFCASPMCSALLLVVAGGLQQWLFGDAVGEKDGVGRGVDTNTVVQSLSTRSNLVPPSGGGGVGRVL